MTRGMKWFLLILGAMVVVSMNFSIHSEFEGPLHQLYLDHMRHHQFEALKEAQKEFQKLF